MADVSDRTTKACSELSLYSSLLGSSCTFESNPDIAGIGVLLSFAISAWAAFALVLTGYFYVEDGLPLDFKNQLDLFVIDTAARAVQVILKIFPNVWSWLTGRPRRDEKRREGIVLNVDILRSAVLTFSDQQLVTGLAILTVGFVTHQDITEYHFATVADLAWLSFTVFSCTIDILRDYFRLNLVSCIWRTVWITAFTVFLGTTIVITGHAYYLWSYGTSIQRIWDTLGTDYSSDPGTLAYVAWDFTTLIVVYLSMMNNLWPGFAKPLLVMISNLVRIPACALNRWSDRVFDWNLPMGLNVLAKVLGILLKAISIFLVALSELIDSYVVGLMVVWWLLLGSTISVFRRRAEAYGSGEMEGDENAWGFGQAVPVIMLALPFLNIAEIYYGK